MEENSLFLRRCQYFFCMEACCLAPEEGLGLWKQKVRIVWDAHYTELFFCLMFLSVAREERLELPTPGFGDQCSTD